MYCRMLTSLCDGTVRLCRAGARICTRKGTAENPWRIGDRVWINRLKMTIMGFRTDAFLFTSAIVKAKDGQVLDIALHEMAPVEAKARRPKIALLSVAADISVRVIRTLSLVLHRPRRPGTP